MMEELTDQSESEATKSEQTYQNEEPSNRVSTSLTFHDLTCYNDQDESNKENNKLFKNKSESDLVVNKNKLNKIYLPAEDTMDLEDSFKESTGKKYSSSWFYGDSSKNPYPTIEEQVKLCRKIASQLVDDENRKSKGAYMFYKRLKKSTKWVHEGNGTKDNQNLTNSSQIADEEVEKLKRNLKLEAMPKLKLILDPRELLSLEKLKKTGDIVEHNIVSPDVCHNIVKDLNSALNSPEINKGAAIFLKRKEKSRDWIVDENKTVEQVREKKREQEIKKQEENVQKEWLMKKQKEQEEFAANTMNDHLPSIDLNAGQQKTLYIQTKQPQNYINLAKPITKLEDSNCSNVPLNNQTVKHNIQANQFLKLNFKNFNRQARGWGVATDEYEKQLQKLQELPEYKLNIPLPNSQPIDQSINQMEAQKTVNQTPLNQPVNQLLSQASNQSVNHFNNQNNLKNSTSSQFFTLQPNYGAYNTNANKSNVHSNIYRSKINEQQQPTSKQPKLILVNSKTKPQNSRPLTNQNHKNVITNKQSPNSNAHPRYLDYINNYNNFASYIFDKQSNRPSINFATYARNENHPYNQSSKYPQSNNTSCYKQESSILNGLSNDHQPYNSQQLYNGIQNNNNLPKIQNYNLSNQQQSNQPQSYLHYVDNSIKPHFDLKKLQIPSQSISIPNFKDFNAKPKLFVK